MVYFCVKCGVEDESDHINENKLEVLGDYHICRKCYRPYLSKYFEWVDFARDFYEDLITHASPERLNERTPEGDAKV